MELHERITALQKQGLNCAQVVMQLYTEDNRVNAPGMIEALRGFGGGVCSGKMCGCLAGAVAAIGLAAGPGDARHPKVRALTKELVQWFEDTFAYTDCHDLKKPPHGERPVSCVELMEKTYKQCAKILEENDLSA